MSSFAVQSFLSIEILPFRDWWYFHDKGFYLYAQPFSIAKGPGSSPDPNIYYRTRYAKANILGFVLNGCVEGAGKRYQYGKKYDYRYDRYQYGK